MKENDYIRVIEDLNLEIINLKNSKEFKIGEKVISLKTKGILNFIKELKIYKDMKKYNHNEPTCNESKIKNDIDVSNKKIAIYSALISDYDEIKIPCIKSLNCDYFMYTDQDFESNIWQKRSLSDFKKKLDNPTMVNRYIKMHPYELFPDYDFAIYIDSSVLVVSNLTSLINSIDLKYGIALHRHRQRDCIYEEIECCHLLKKGNYEKLEQQKEEYLKANFPRHYGMLECTIIVSEIKNKKGCEIFDKWWEEFSNSSSLRDQISLPYILWKMDIKINDLDGLGNNIFKNKKIRIFNKHKR